MPEARTMTPGENPFAAPKRPGSSAPGESGVRKKQNEEEFRRRRTFGFAESEHPVAERYVPVFLGAGGENLVYEIPGRPKLVAKANKKVIYDTLTQDPFSDTYEQEDVSKSGVLRDQELKMKQEREVLKKLRNVFGEEHLVTQRKFLRKVPVTPEILEEIEKQFSGSKTETLAKDVSEAWTILTLQEKLDIPDDALCPKSNYPEYRYAKQGWMDDPDREFAYREATDTLMNADRAEQADQMQFLDFMGSLPLEDLADRLYEDPSLREAVRDFVVKAQTFAEESGEILDVVGMNNIVFYEEEGKWTYKLIDPIYPFVDRVLDRARKAYLSGKEPKEMTSEEHVALVHGVVFTRLINGLSLLLNRIEHEKPAEDMRLTPYMDFLPDELMTTPMADKIFPKKSRDIRAA